MSFCMFHAAEAGLIVNILDRFVLQCTGSRDCYIVKLTLTHNEYHRKHISVLMFKFEINHLSRCIFSFSINFQESFVRQKYLLRDSHSHRRGEKFQNLLSKNSTDDRHSNDHKQFVFKKKLCLLVRGFLEADDDVRD
jgi:hypothetical protein